MTALWRICDFPVPGSPTSNTCISPLILVPSGVNLGTPPNRRYAIDSFSLHIPYKLGAMLKTIFCTIHGSLASSLIFSSSSLVMTTSSNIFWDTLTDIASMNGVKYGFVWVSWLKRTIPTIVTLSPGLAISTRSRVNLTCMLLGSCPPGVSSGFS